MTQNEFDTIIQEAFAATPETIRTRIKNCAFIVEECPRNDEETDLLGSYRGIPDTEWESSYSLYPHTIVLFRKNIEEEAALQDGDIARVIRQTVWHEIGHYLGMEEEHIETYEQKWENEWRARTKKSEKY